MRRSCVVAIIGLVAGLSGCAGTHQCVVSKPMTAPGCPTCVVGPTCCHKHAGAPMVASAVPGPAAPAPRRATAVATASHYRWPTPSATPAEPDPNRPIPVPAPAPNASRPASPPASPVAHYLPSLDWQADEGRSPWDSEPPDLLGVRTSMATGGAGLRAVQGLAPRPVSEPSLLQPLSLRPTPRPRSGGLLVMLADRFRRDREITPTTAIRATSPTPAAAPVRVASTAGAAAKPADPSKTIDLEVITDPSLAGRPKWGSVTQAALPRDDAWKSEKPVPAGFRFFSFRNDPAWSSPKPKRESIVGRFARRIRVAGRAFLDPDSIGGKPRDIAEQGERIQRASAERLDEPSKR